MIKDMVDEGWDFMGQFDDGDFVFTREFAGVVFAANIHEDR